MLNYTASTTSTVPDEYFKNQENGYKDGFDWAVKQINDRFLNWLIVGLLIGLVIGFFVSDGILTFLSVLALYFLVDKLRNINIK